jgi:hypothetical protein
MKKTTPASQEGVVALKVDRMATAAVWRRTTAAPRRR